MRRAARAGSFYPADRESAQKLLDDCLRRRPEGNLPHSLVAAIAPHAGWIYSGATAGLAFRALAERTQPPEILVFFGAVHTVHLHRPSIDAESQWETPLGPVEVDRAFLDRLLSLGRLEENPLAHREEHSIEVLVPFVRKLFPQARIAPIATPPTLEARDLGLIVAEEARRDGRRIVAIGSTDLTHYGKRYYGFAPAGEGESALRWAAENDRKLLDPISAGRAEAILPEAIRHSNACGAGAATAAVAFARGMGRERGVLLEHTNSHEVRREGPATDFVGYAAVVF